MVSSSLVKLFDFPINHFHDWLFYVVRLHFPCLCQKLWFPASSTILGYKSALGYFTVLHPGQLHHLLVVILKPRLIGNFSHWVLYPDSPTPSSKPNGQVDPSLSTLILLTEMNMFALIILLFLYFKTIIHSYYVLSSMWSHVCAPSSLSPKWLQNSFKANFTVSSPISTFHLLTLLFRRFYSLTS